MKFDRTVLDGAFVVKLDMKMDDRGWFTRTFCKEEFREIGFAENWVQINHSSSKLKGTVRGMHFQNLPHVEVKLVRCIRGAVLDVIVDIRFGSPTFLQWFAVELTAENGQMIYIPRGFAHGFQTLTDEAELIYHHSEYYAPEAEDGLRYDDPLIGINWPLAISNISERDQKRNFIDLDFKGIDVK